MSAYIGDVVKNGLVLYLDAANSKSYVSGSNTWFDLSGNNNSGSLTNGPTFSSDGKGSIVFDGTNDYVNLGNILNFTSSFTVELYFNASAWNDEWVGLLTKGDTAWRIHRLAVDTPIKINFTVTGLSSVVNTASTINTNIWYHLVCVYNGTQLLIYLNGSLDATQNVTGTPSTNTKNLAVGWNADFSGRRFFNGKIPVVKIYNRALSPAEILENYNATKGRFDTPRAINSVQPRLVTNGLVMCLDAGNRESYVSGSTSWLDLSGNNYSGSLINGPTFNSSNNGNIVFDGTNDYATCGPVLNFGSSTSVGTILIFAKGSGIFFSNKRTSPGHGWVQIYTVNTSSLNLYIDAYDGLPYGEAFSASFSSTPYSSSINQFNLYSVVINRPSNAYTIGINNYFFTTTKSFTVGSYNNFNTIDIGRHENWIYGTSYFSGSIANVVVYNRVLSQTEILQTYNFLKGRFGL
jgi:hypothetical protein